MRWWCRAALTGRQQKFGEQSAAARLEVLNAIQQRLVGNTVALEYFQSAFPDFEDFWLFRRRLSYQLGALTFMTYILYIDKRYPHKINIARRSGNVWGSELLSFMMQAKPFFQNQEPVPFRLTPNLQTLMGPLATEGIFSCSVMAIARCLTDPEFELEHALTLFVRDEMIFWFTNSHRSAHLSEAQLRETVQANSDMIVKRAVSLAQAPPVGNLPANQTVIDLIAKAVNPMNPGPLRCPVDALYVTTAWQMSNEGNWGGPGLAFWSGNGGMGSQDGREGEGLNLSRRGRAPGGTYRKVSPDSDGALCLYFLYEKPSG